MSFRFYTLEDLGPKQSLTPEKYLLCEDVAIARTGSLLYAAGEVPVTPGDDGLVRISREEDDVFSESALSSFNGKHVTNDHPTEKVAPDNYRQYAVGTVLHPRRGAGPGNDSQLLYADLLIYDPDTISDIRAGKRQVSAGYDADYDEIAPGMGRQRNIIGNHVALVDKGRCGELCAIGDQMMAVATPKRAAPRRGTTFHDQLLSRFYAGDEEGIKALAELPEMEGRVLSGDAFPPKKEGEGDKSDSEGGEPEKAAPDFPAAKAPESGSGSNAQHVVNVHVGSHQPVTNQGPEGAGTGGNDPAQAVNPAANGADLGNEANPMAGNTGGDIQAIMQRLDRIEEAIAILVQGDGEPEQPGVGDAAPKTGAKDEEGYEEKQLERAAGDKKVADKTVSFEASDRKRSAHDSDTVGAARTTGTPIDKDSTAMRVGWQNVMSLAEMIVPGIVSDAPTFDAKLPASTTVDALCSFRKTVLKAAARTADGRELLRKVMPEGTSISDQMTCDAAAMAFNGAAEIMRLANNNKMLKVPLTAQPAARAQTAADINAINRKKYGLVN